MFLLKGNTLFQLHYGNYSRMQKMHYYMLILCIFQKVQYQCKLCASFESFFIFIFSLIFVVFVHWIAFYCHFLQIKNKNTQKKPQNGTSKNPVRGFLFAFNILFFVKKANKKTHIFVCFCHPSKAIFRPMN